ncbi:30S ribosomal protein S16 [Patescibacteria group bacterium AH-259-L07]|nr:30S ribosomal protein S16 [Patescibacteria group bacterium AH-259-L07]
MLAIKFSRKGKRNQPFFRIIVLEKSKDPWGDFLEDLGFYNPLTKECSLNEKRIKYWISNGAQPTGSVHNLLVNKGIIKAEKVNVTKKRVSKKKEAPKEATDKKEEKKEKVEEKAEEDRKGALAKEEKKEERKEEKSPKKEAKEEKKEEGGKEVEKVT